MAGSLKGDAPPLSYDGPAMEALKQQIGGRPLLIAAQTHPGEDETVLPAHDILRRNFPNLLTLLIPRQPDRGPAMAQLCGARKAARRAAGEMIGAETQVYIADTLGELGLFYRLAPFCFIGGTLVALGGHNPLEPAVLHCAILAGPYRASAANAYDAIIKAQGFGDVLSSADIARRAGQLLSDPVKRGGRPAKRRRRAPRPRRARWRAPSRCWKIFMRAPDFWKSRGILALLLAPLGWLYGLSVALKARGARPYKAGVPVICVGNLTAGGSGKTPVAMAVAQALRARGGDVFFLTRGYGGSAEGPLLVSQRQTAALVGDEALLLARTAPTVMSKNRAAGAVFAVKHGATAIVMDDGHQNFSSGQEFCLLVVVDDVGNGLMIPAGPLRETVAQGLARADAVIAMRDAGFAGLCRAGAARSW